MPKYVLSGAWLCHEGRHRPANEDACLAAGVCSGLSTDLPQRIELKSSPWIVAVSDGIGGHCAGAEASRTVVEELASCSRVTPNGIGETLRRVNGRLCRKGRKDEEFTAMGATVAGVAAGPKGLFAFNVGDSRVYEMRRDQLLQITRDDSEAEELVDQGLLSDEDGGRPSFLHSLTQAVGGHEEFVEIAVHVHPLQIEQSSRLLVCSDGLTDMLARSEIQTILASEADAESAVRALFTAAMNAGGMDNITLALLDVREEKGRSVRQAQVGAGVIG